MTKSNKKFTPNPRKAENLIFSVVTKMYISSVISDRISDGLQGQVRGVPRDAPWSRARGGLGWTYTGPHLWWGAQQTKSGTIRPTANRFRAV